MKAKIDVDGMLTVIPESEIETYALKCWWQRYMQKCQFTEDTTEISLRVELGEYED